MSEHKDDSNQDHKGPSHLAYDVKDIGKDNAVWNRVGAAWQHKDGKGFDVTLDALPLSGRISLREQRKEDFKDQRRDSGASQNREQNRDK